MNDGSRLEQERSSLEATEVIAFYFELVSNLPLSEVGDEPCVFPPIVSSNTLLAKALGFVSAPTHIKAAELLENLQNEVKWAAAFDLVWETLKLHGWSETPYRKSVWYVMPNVEPLQLRTNHNTFLSKTSLLITSIEYYYTL